MAQARDVISIAMARRAALAAQGFGEARPCALIERRHFNRAVNRLNLLQIDSVSAVVRAHYMPVFSRLGPYPMGLLEEAASKRPRRLFEYWAHEASFLPVEMWPLMQWRMARAARGEGIYKGIANFGRERKTFIDEILQEVTSRGPMAASDIEGHKGSGGSCSPGCYGIDDLCREPRWESSGNVPGLLHKGPYIEQIGRAHV